MQGHWVVWANDRPRWQHLASAGYGIQNQEQNCKGRNEMKAKEHNPEIRPSCELPLFEQSFTKFEQAHARASDPATSRQAAASVSLTNLGKTKEAILDILSSGPKTDEEIAKIFHSWGKVKASPSGLRTRRAWLAQNGFVEAAGGFNEDGTTWGITGKTAAKRNCIVWRLK